MSDQCENCYFDDAEPLHICPYNEAVECDSLTLCNCCDDCRSECCENI